MSRFTRMNYWSRVGGAESGMWGSQAIGKGAGLAPGFGIHWQPAGRGTVITTGPGIPPKRFMTNAFTMAMDEAAGEFEAAIEMVGRLAEDMCNRNRYAQKHKAKMAEAEAKGWKNLGLSFDNLRPSKAYQGVDKMGHLTRPETAELVNAKSIGLTDANIRQIARLGTHQTQKIGGFLVTREKMFDQGWIDFTFQKMQTGEKYFIEAAVSDFRSLKASDVKLKMTETTYGAIPGLNARLAGGALIRFYATNHITPGLTKTAENAHQLFYTGAMHWKEAFYRHVRTTFRTVSSPTPKFRTETAKDFDPVLNIDARVNVPRNPRSMQPKYYELRIFTAHPVATSHEYGLAGTSTGITKMTVPTIRGLGEPSWRFREYE
jgi:hypothetical protein